MAVRPARSDHTYCNSAGGWATGRQLKIAQLLPVLDSYSVLPACKVPASYTLTLRGVTLAISPDYAVSCRSTLGITLAISPDYVVSRINSRAGANNTVVTRC